MPTADIHSVSELARRSRVQRDTLYAWFRGDQPPKPGTLEKVAQALHVRLGDLWDYEREGDGPPPAISPELLEEIRVAVAAGVAEGVARALDAAASQAPQPPRRRQSH